MVPFMDIWTFLALGGFSVLGKRELTELVLLPPAAGTTNTFAGEIIKAATNTTASLEQADDQIPEDKKEPPGATQPQKLRDVEDLLLSLHVPMAADSKHARTVGDVEDLTPFAPSSNDVVNAKAIKIHRMKNPKTDANLQLKEKSLEGGRGATYSSLGRTHIAEVPQLPVQRHTTAQIGDTRQPSLLFGVFTSPKEPYRTRLHAQMKTWMRDLNPQELVIVGADPPLGMEGRAQWDAATDCLDNHGAGLACKETTMLQFAHGHDADWLWVLGDDNYVLPKEAKYALQKHDPNEPVILGTPGCATKKCSGMCGGAGELISRGALKHMFEEGSDKLVREYKAMMKECENWCDQTTSTVAKRHMVSLQSIKGVYGWHKDTMEIQRIIEEHSELEIDDPPLLFHYVSPAQMYEIHSHVEESKRRMSFLPKVDLSLMQARQSVHANYEAEVEKYVRYANACLYSNMSTCSSEGGHVADLAM